MALVPLVSAAQVPQNLLVPRIGLNALGFRWPNDSADPVDLRLSDGTTVRCFDSKITALSLLEQMRNRRQAYVSLSDDVACYAVSQGAKLIVCENTLQNQRLWASFSADYTAGQTRFIHRSLSSVQNLFDALSSVGATVTGQLSDNRALANLFMAVVDWNYKAAPSDASRGSVLDDGFAAALNYRYENPLDTAVQPVLPGVPAPGDLSDIRLKKDVAPLASSLEAARLLRPVSYKWISNDVYDAGLIAQEVAVVAPECVAADDAGFLRVNYARLVPYLLQWLQLLSEKVRSL